MSRGKSGDNINIALANKVDITGTYPNLNPSYITDEVGKEQVDYFFTENGGVQKTNTAIPSYKQLDNSADVHGGTYNIIAMNKLIIESAGGGLIMNSSGNINIMSTGGLINLFGTELISTSSKVLNLTSKVCTTIASESIIFKSDKIIFENNVTFGSNIMCNGGAFFGGETFITHLSTEKQRNMTEDSKGVGYINPKANLFLYIKGGFPMSIPGIGDVNVSIPTPIQVNLGSLGFLNPLNGEADVLLAPHFHEFDGPACKTYDSRSDLWKASKRITDKDAIGADASLPFGMKPEEHVEKVINKKISETKSWAKNQALKFAPNWLKKLVD